MNARPALAHEWPALARAAARLLADRERGYPAAVAAGRLTQAEADVGIAAMRVLANQWRLIEAREPVPPIDDLAARHGTFAAIVLKQLRGAAEATAARAADRPEDAFAQVYAECVAALAWHQRPWDNAHGEPHILFVHALNLQLRRRATDFAQAA